MKFSEGNGFKVIYAAIPKAVRAAVVSHIFDEALKSDDEGLEAGKRMFRFFAESLTKCIGSSGSCIFTRTIAYVRRMTKLTHSPCAFS